MAKLHRKQVISIEGLRCPELILGQIGLCLVYPLLGNCLLLTHKMEYWI